MNLRFAIKDISEMTRHGITPYEEGYRDGSLFALESELRFLEGLLKVSEAA
jgi:hypothetical protein